jgi:glycosyltransferase involved in cell wall biosynthesis
MKSSDQNKGISIIVPIFNEVDSIENCASMLKKISFTGNFKKEIIFINDGSSDGSEKKINQIKGIKVINHKFNSGYGASIKNGVVKSKYNNICITDADGTYPSNKIDELLNVLTDKNFDMVIGSRTGKNVNIPLIRRPAKWFIGMLANYVTSKNIPDINSGLRVFRKASFLKFYNIIPNGFSLTTTITLGMILGNYNIKFIDINYAKRAGKSKIRPFRDTLNFISLILRIGLYFAPLKIFIPISVFLFLIGLTWGLVSKYYFGKLADLSSLIIVIASFQTFLFALIGELINKRMPNRFDKK